MVVQIALAYLKVGLSLYFRPHLYTKDALSYNVDLEQNYCPLYVQPRAGHFDTFLQSPVSWA